MFRVSADHIKHVLATISIFGNDPNISRPQTLVVGSLEQLRLMFVLRLKSIMGSCGAIFHRRMYVVSHMSSEKRSLMVSFIFHSPGCSGKAR